MIWPPTIGATYATTRGTFTVLEVLPEVCGIGLRRSDGRQALVAISDWLTWHPQIVDDTTSQPQDMVDE